MSLMPVLLLLGAVILVNGWTDAPNAIAAPVSSGVLPFPAAVLLAAFCNLMGVVCTMAISDAVARTLFSIADFGPQALTALTAALAATVLWGVLAWRFGIPTSESHALIAGLMGSALALGVDRLRLGPLLRTGRSFWGCWPLFSPWERGNFLCPSAPAGPAPPSWPWAPSWEAGASSIPWAGRWSG